MSLDELAIKHGTDKGSSHPRLTPKRYAEVYEALFGHMAIKSLLELGVAKGASLRMWADWLPSAMIVGIEKGTLPNVDRPNVRLYRGRQEDGALLESVSRAYGPWDVVIDDGSHRAFDQLASLEKLWPHVAGEGFYAIEDLHAPDSCTVTDVEAMLGQEAESLTIVSKRLVVVRKAQVYVADSPPTG